MLQTAHVVKNVTLKKFGEITSGSRASFEGGGGLGLKPSRHRLKQPPAMQLLIGTRNFRDVLEPNAPLVAASGGNGAAEHVTH